MGVVLYLVGGRYCGTREKLNILNSSCGSKKTRGSFNKMVVCAVVAWAPRYHPRRRTATSVSDLNFGWRFRLRSLDCDEDRNLSLTGKRRWRDVSTFS
jgi:hypothetical protein